MKAAVFAVLLLACGRVGFDPHGGGSDAQSGADARDSAAQQCPSGTACALCRSSSITVIRGGAIFDDDMAAALADQVRAACALTPAVVDVSQDDPGVLDPTTDRPLLPAGALGVLGGGDFFQRGIGYLSISDTPLVTTATSTNLRVVVRSTSAVVVDMPLANIDSTHDIARVMLTQEPIGGATFVSFEGHLTDGTIAAGFWFSTIVPSAISSDPSRWYVVEWWNADADPKPSAGDTFTVIASG